jgi:glycosyltransferase involved in cell wall biosynthesis
MKIIFAHNTYQHFGGEDSVLAAELKLLRDEHHNVRLFQVDNMVVKGVLTQLKTALSCRYSIQSKKNMQEKLESCQPDLVHVHNFFPLLTPSIYDACIEAGVPVVQTLHNFRTICPGALLMRDGGICEKCVTGTPYQSIPHRCYRNSISGSWAVARMVAYHRRKQTWKHKVDRFISLTQFSKQKFIEAGFPAEKIVVKPNFCEVADSRVMAQNSRRNGALFVGRLSKEKGVATLLKAWRGLDIPLRVAGRGPLFSNHENNHDDCIQFLGQISREQVDIEMTRASFLVMPSECYEGFPMVLVESFSRGLPVIASRLGGMAEIVEDVVTGLHFEPGNSDDLAQKVKWIHDHPQECHQMGENARRIYEEKYTPAKNYKILMDVYEQAICGHQG